MFAKRTCNFFPWRSLVARYVCVVSEIFEKWIRSVLAVMRSVAAHWGAPTLRRHYSRHDRHPITLKDVDVSLRRSGRRDSVTRVHSIPAVSEVAASRRWSPTGGPLWWTDQRLEKQKYQSSPSPIQAPHTGYINVFFAFRCSIKIN